MSYRIFRTLLSALLIVLVIAPLTVWAADGDQTVEVRLRDTQAAGGGALMGEELTVEVWVSNVANLYGADIRLQFDNTRLMVLDADTALPGVQIQPLGDLLAPDFVVRQVANNKLGTIWYAVTQLNPRPAAAGSGPLFSFTVVTTGAGLGQIDVVQQLLITRDLQVIDAATVGAQVDVRADASQTQTTPRVRLPVVVVAQ